VISEPLTENPPRVGFSIVHRRRINVDFPLPFPPISAERPGENVTETSLTASVVPVRDLKVLLSELVRIKELPSD